MNKSLFESIQLPQDPIFIVGYPRSGTTLLQAMLATQEGIYTLPETHFFNVVEKKIEIDEDGGIRLSCLDEVFKKIYEKMDFSFNEEELKVIKDDSVNKRLTSKILFERIIYKFISKEVANSDLKFRWMEKTPNHLYFIDRIYDLYPESKFIHIIRHPAAAILSRKKNFPFNKDTPIERLVEFWKRSIKCAEAFKKKYPDSIYSLKYEDLAYDYRKEMISIFEFLNISYNINVISNFKNAKNFILKFEHWKNNIFSRSIKNTNFKYINKQNKRDISIIGNLLNTEMKKYGYI
jgi:hypothetical protein